MGGSCVPVSEFGSAWPDGVPVQVHGMNADPIFVGEGDINAARVLVAPPCWQAFLTGPFRSWERNLATWPRTKREA